MTYIERIVNIETGETSERPYTESEIAEVETNLSKIQEMAERQAEAAAMKAALLDKLGITEDEAKLLLS